MTYGMNPILIICAVVPAFFLLRFVYRQDKLEKEAPQTLVKLIFWGMVSTLIAILLEEIGDFVLINILGLNNKSIEYIALSNFIVVGFSEEWAKFVVLKKRTWKSPEFNCSFDGVVYAVFVSLGFAIWENIKYVEMFGFQTALVRAVTAVPGHASFGVFMGIWYAMAKRAEINGKPFQRRNCLIMAVVLPAIIHGAYDFIATIDSILYSSLFVPFIVVMFIFAFEGIKRESKNDTYITDNVDNVNTTYNAPPKDNDYTKYKYKE